jgi:hypothetical protein
MKLGSKIVEYGYVGIMNRVRDLKIKVGFLPKRRIDLGR